MTARLIDIGSHRLNARIAGRGMPVVVLESHFAGTMQIWRKVWRSVTTFATVVAYDRAGLGGSDPGPLPRTALRVAEDLRRLLNRAPLPPPYILVGHSFGGLFAQAFARKHSDLVAGLVLVDTSHEDGERRMWPTISAAVRERALQFRRNNPEHVDIGRSLAQIRRLEPMADVPIVVLHAPIKIGSVVGPRPDDRWTREQEALSQKLSLELAQRSKLGRLVIVRRSSHFIQIDRPEVVISAVREVVRAVRAR
jgi:pimeloyl-ACP methyl ester carboxylesterase